MTDKQDQAEIPAEKAPRQRQRVAGTKRTSQHPGDVDKSKNPFTPWMRGDLLKLEDMDGDYEFRWCSKHDHQGIARRESQGFVRVTAQMGLKVKSLGTPRLQDGAKSETGVIEEGDLVLMALPKELAEMRREAVEDRNAEVLAGTLDQLDSNVSSAGAPLHGEGVSLETERLKRPRVKRVEV